ncbi:hypothetical protein IK146_03530 [Candidatus Saccharibacteria bacterium]|nr:hypothetical protein [Candidatus Saccharibacteria bacterium]
MQKVWGIRIEDQHDKGESEPHYILEVGLGDYKVKTRHALYSVTYCDYRSVLKGEEEGVEENSILLNPGKYMIHIWLPENENKTTFSSFANKVNHAYYDAMKEALPNYAILADEIYYEGSLL